MNTTHLRRFAAGAGAAVALLGGAATVVGVDAPAASAAEARVIATDAVTAPVTLPDGRTIRVMGMGGYGHTATQAHVDAVAAHAVTVADSPDASTGLTPNGGAGAPLQLPGQTPAYQPQQITTQASGGVVAVGIVSIIVLTIVVIFRIKHGHVKPMDAVLVGLLGISLAGTVIGSMGNQITTSLVSALGGVLGGL